MDGFVLASTATDEGTMWRAELEDDSGRLTDATRWTLHPRQAHADGDALVAGRYWCSDSQPRFTHAA